MRKLHTKWLSAFSAACAASLLALSVAGTASAAVDRPLRLVLPFPPGGSTDIASRIIQPKLAEILGRTVIVDNRPGAASQVATQHVARSRPDGDTLLISFDNHSINPAIKKELPYDTFKDFRGITFALRFPLVIVASKKTPGDTLTDFIAAVKANPQKYSYASTGLGSLNHLAPEEFKRRAGIETFLHVPYSGGGPAVQSLLGEISNVTFLSYAALKSHIEAGTVRALAVTGETRLPELPKTPTVAESGFPGFEAYSWIGVFAPAETPDDVANNLTVAFQKALNDPGVKKQLTDLGFEVMATDAPTVEKYAVQQYERWAQFVKETGLKLE